MMNRRRSLKVASVLAVGGLVLFTCTILQRSDQISATSEPSETARQKRVAEIGYDSFSNDINTCLFSSWSRYNKKNPIPVLGELAVCKGKRQIGLCYGANRPIAQYAACYNTKTLIPEFTGHIVQPNIGGKGRDAEFRADTGVEPVATDEDYKLENQMGLYANYNRQKQQFFARGHLTPNADFTTDEERAYTMITTNVAPQWQLFNGGNWENLEKALRKNATQTNQALYVFTGTGLKRTRIGGKNEKDVVIKLNKRVLAPQWYWKAVCDPIAKQSVFFLGENTIGDVKGMEGQQAKGCYGKVQTKKYGVIHCFSLSDAKEKFKKEFLIPTFHKKNCVPSKIGAGFQPLIERNLV